VGYVSISYVFPWALIRRAVTTSRILWDLHPQIDSLALRFAHPYRIMARSWLNDFKLVDYFQEFFEGQTCIKQHLP
jgi:hypothetical protein